MGSTAPLSPRTAAPTIWVERHRTGMQKTVKSPCANVLAAHRSTSTIVAMSYTGLRANDTSRKVIDTAIGVLVGLRGCSPAEAFTELVQVTRQTGIGIGTIASGLVAVASGTSSADNVDAFNIWGELIRAERVTSPA
jgi:hypothetical protein